MGMGDRMSGIAVKIKRLVGKNKIKVLAAAVPLLLLWFMPIKDNISICIEYSREYDNNFGAQVFWRGEEDFQEEKSSYGIVKHNRVELEIAEDMEKVQGLRLDPTNVCQQLAITSIQVRNHGIGMEMLPVRELFERAEYRSTEAPVLSLSVLYLNPLDNDPMIVLGQDIIQEYFLGHTVKFKMMLSAWCLIAELAVAIGLHYLSYLKAYLNKILDFICGRYFTIVKMVLFIAAFLVIYMAFFSFDYAHPDENMSKAAVEYYMEHWVPADIQSKEAADSFSTYGYSRLSEITVYYFLAGKAAWAAKNILGLSKYYRAFNVLLFIAMVFVFCKKGKQNPWLYLMIGLTPQVWYIFSYTTSDAWDYFLSFIILYQLTGEESIFNRVLHAKMGKRAAVQLLMVGAVFGLLLLGKKNYYFIFVSSFFFLLYKLLAEKQENRVQTIIKYGIVVTICLSVFGGASYADMLRYDGNKGEIARQQSEIYVENTMESNINSVSQANRGGIAMKSQGISLEQMLLQHGFLKYSYQSYMGKYGWMEYESPGWYYVSIGVIYCLILLLLIWIMLQNGAVSKKMLFCLLLASNLIIVAASIWKSWVGDFQPQGRYLFAMNFNIAICAYLYSNLLFDKKIMKVAICFVGVLIAYSYVMGGIIFLT